MESGPSGSKGGSSLPLQDGQVYVADKKKLSKGKLEWNKDGKRHRR
jgi:hypothetical protein